MSTSGFRDRSREEVHRLILNSGGMTRAEIAALTGMSRSAVTNVVGQLIQEQRVVEEDPRIKGPGGGSGRPARMVVPRASGIPVVGLDFGHNHVWVAVADALGQPLGDARVRIDVDNSATEAMDAATDLLTGLRERLGIDRIGAVVAGVPGPVEGRTGRVKSPTILSGWVGLSPGDELAERLGMEVRVENDAVLGAYGELRLGAGVGHREFLYIKASNGIGAGIVINGQPFVGANGIAGEIGHTQLPSSGELCRCGQRGCLEAVVSVQAIRSQLAHTHPHLDAEEIDLAELDDAISARMLNEAGRTIGRVLADLCNLINPSALIIGGELGASGPALIDGVRSSIHRYAQPATAASVEVSASKLGIRSELTGALQMASVAARTAAAL
ncbi:ROK family transcriptional regulator [Nakamurella silvestris]|nr:ROK family transcriptional regulator [Nakamurella silvestris]